MLIGPEDWQSGGVAWPLGWGLQHLLIYGRYTCSRPYNTLILDRQPFVCILFSFFVATSILWGIDDTRGGLRLGYYYQAQTRLVYCVVV